jgi:dGTPase
VEAADDICYHIIDFEDGLRLRWIDFSLAEELLIPIAGSSLFLENYQRILHQDEKVSYLRAVAINSLIKEMAALFLENEEAMLAGSFDQSLMNLSSHKNEIDRIKKISLEKVYKAREVIEIEAAGFEVIGGLLEMFLDALNQLCEQDKQKSSYRSAKIAELFPDYLKTPKDELKQSLYLRIIAVCEFVAGLTDRHAISLYRKLKGIELPR